MVFSSTFKLLLVHVNMQRSKQSSQTIACSYDDFQRTSWPCQNSNLKLSSRKKIMTFVGCQLTFHLQKIIQHTDELMTP